MSRLGVSIFRQHAKCNALVSDHLRRHIATFCGIVRYVRYSKINGLQLARQMHV